MTVTKQHKNLVPADGMHVIHAWEVADTAARDALSLETGDIGKVAKVGTEFHVLGGLSPVVWHHFTADHGSLSGLLDDDHTIYLLADGTRSMAGDLNLGGNNITNVADFGGGTLTLSGNATVGGTLGVAGATTLSSLSTSGNATVGGTLGVTGAATFSSNVTLDSASPALTLGNLTGSPSIVLKKNESGSSTLVFDRPSSNANFRLLHNNFDVFHFQFSIGGAYSTIFKSSAPNGFFECERQAYFATLVQITGAATLSGGAALGGTLNLAGNAITNVGNLTTNASTTMTVGGALSVAGNATVGGTLGVTGATTLTGGATLGANLAMGTNNITNAGSITMVSTMTMSGPGAEIAMGDSTGSNSIHMYAGANLAAYLAMRDGASALWDVGKTHNDKNFYIDNRSIGGSPLVISSATSAITLGGPVGCTANVTLDSGSPVLTLGNSTGSPRIEWRRGAAVAATERFYGSGTIEWQLEYTGAGDLRYGRYVGGAFQDYAFGMANSTGLVVVAQGFQVDGAIEMNGALNHDGSTAGLYGATPVVQASDPGALTDSSGGTADGTVAAVSGSGADTTINNNFADLTAKYNTLRTIIRNIGIAA